MFTHFVLSEPRDKVGRCSDVSEVSLVISSAYFQRPDDILEIILSLGINEKDSKNMWTTRKNVIVFISLLTGAQS